MLRGCDIAFRREGLPCEPQDADEVVYQFRQQKADQVTFGTCRSHHRSGSPLCVVSALVALALAFPARFQGGSEAELPLCRWPDGAQITELLEEAVVAVGLPPSRFRPHSLRIGGASALYHATGDTEVVKRCGRWSSGAFHGYLWDSSEHYKDIAQKMAGVVASIHYT